MTCEPLAPLSPQLALQAFFNAAARFLSENTSYLHELLWPSQLRGGFPLSASVLVLTAVVTGLRLSRSFCFGDGVYLRQRVLLLVRIRAFVVQWEASCMKEVETCCADVDNQASAVLARYMGWRAAKGVHAWWTATMLEDVPLAHPPIPVAPSFAGIVPSFAFSNHIVLEEELELAYVADNVLRLAEDRRWLERFVTILQYVLLRRVSQMQEAQLYRCLCQRALFPCHSATQKCKRAAQGEGATQCSTWAAAWRVYHRPTWLAPLPGSAQFLCLPLSYFPVEAVLPYLACETWLSERLLSTILPRWVRLCVRSLQQAHKRAPHASLLRSDARAERMSSKVQYWFLRYTAPLLRTCVEEQRSAAHRFCMQELSTAAGYDYAAPSDYPRSSLALLWRCMKSTCTYPASAIAAASPSADSLPQRRSSMDGDRALPNKETYGLVRRVLILRAVSQAVVIILQVCSPRLSVRYVMELMVAGYCARGKRTPASTNNRITTGVAVASPVDTLLSSMASDMGWAIAAGIVESLLTRFTGATGHQLSVLLADVGTQRLEQELLCVDEAFYCRWLRSERCEADCTGAATRVAALSGRLMSVPGMLLARPLTTADDILRVGRRGGERMLALHDAVVKRFLRYTALIGCAAVTGEWRPLVGGILTAWVDAPALLSSFSVAVGYSTPSDVTRLLSRREETLPSRSPVGLRLLLEVLVEEESSTRTLLVTRQRGQRRLRNPYVALVACSSVWTFEHLLADTKRSAANLCAHVRQLKAVYAAVAAYPYAASSGIYGTKAADVMDAMQEDVRCILHYSVYEIEHTSKKRCADAGATLRLLHPLLDPEETALLQQPSALSYLPAHVDYFDLFSLPYRFILRQLGLEMVFAYRTASGMQQESRQMAEEWWAQALFNSTFNPLTSALHEALQLTASCATVVFFSLHFLDGMWVVLPPPFPMLIKQAHAVQSYRDLLRSGVLMQRLADGVAPLQQLCENLPHAVVSEAATLARSSLQYRNSSAASLSVLQQRRRHWRRVLSTSRPELCFGADDRIVGGLRLRDGFSWHHVYFTYPQLFAAPNENNEGQESASRTGSVQPTLTDACFACPAVGMTAVVGPSGAGKSSLNLLLRRLYDPVAVVELAHDNGAGRSPRDEGQRDFVDLNCVGATADAEDVLLEVLRLALVESVLPPPSNNKALFEPSFLSPVEGHGSTSQSWTPISAPPVNSARYSLRVQPGYIALDGIPLSLFATAYVRQWLGWLRQTPHVHPRQSFLSNVRGTAMYVTACDAQRALRVCGCDTFMEEKHLTLRDTVGHLSSGEAQRLALASIVAAFLARSRLELLYGMPLQSIDSGSEASEAAVGGLVLDEPTSNLDAASEHHLLAALEALQEGEETDSQAGTRWHLFTWIISHRMSSMRSAQHMVVVEDGRVTASGPSAQLLDVLFGYYGSSHDAWFHSSNTNSPRSTGAACNVELQTVLQIFPHLHHNHTARRALMNGGGSARHAEAGFPFWVNDIDLFASPTQRELTPSCSLLCLQDLFRCDVADPGECWENILLSSYVTDPRWLLATVPELSAVTGKLVVLSGEKATATLRRITSDPSSPYMATSPLMNRVNPFVAALREHAQSTSTLHAARLHERLVVLEPPLPVAFGTHHTKIALCINKRGLRVCIFTANLVEQDWCWKSQGIYMQDFPWKTSTTHCSKGCTAGATMLQTALGSSSDGSNDSNPSVRGAEFVAHLRHYLRQCGLSLAAACTSPTDAACATGPLGIFDTDFLSHIDFSAAAVWLISSVPGTYAHGEVSPGYRVGLCRLAEVLRRSELTMARAPASVDLSWQYSSQGSLNPEFLNSLQAAMCGESDAAIESGVAPRGVRDVKVVYPTEKEVRNSWEGWRGGESLPLRVQCCHEFVNARLHRWGTNEGVHTAKCAFLGRAKVVGSHASREDAVDVDGVSSDGGEETMPPQPGHCAACRQFALPHIKSYAAVAPDRSCIHWFLLTSANLSQAAWGSLSRKVNKRGSRQQFVRSYELGVLYDYHSAIDPSSSSWFSVVAKSNIKLPTARNSCSILYETPLGVDASDVCLYIPYNILYPTPYASTAALREHRRASGEGDQSVEGGALDCSDVPWVLDMPHRGKDAYGLEVEEAFESSVFPTLPKWWPPTRATETAPRRSLGATRKRMREA